MRIFPRKILVATDGSREAILAAHSAAQLARETRSELHIIYVRPRRMPTHPGHFLGPEVAEHPFQREQELLERKAQRILDAQVKEIEAAGGSVAQTHVVIGKPAEEIISLGEELGAGLIVVGSRGRGGLRRALIGSVSDSVVRHAHCPVLVVRHPGWPQMSGPRRSQGSPREQRMSLENVRHLTLRYSRARPEKMEICVEYVGGRIKVFEVERYLVERLLDQLEDQEA